ncbi:MAG: M1 family metallopeptidase [Armatimonadetes bacterium]|nr:M1 family metallopeptidase [Armatimonadota bacterium]
MLSSLAFGYALLLNPAVRPPHEYDLQDVKFDLSLDFKNESISGYVANKVVTTKNDATLWFDKGPMTVTGISVDGARTYNAKAEGDHVHVNLKGVGKGKTVTVTIKYHAEPEAGIYFVSGKRAYPATTDLAYTQGEMEDNHYWIPTYDYPDDKATSEGIIRVPKGMSVLSNGTLIDHKDVGAQSVWHWKMDQPMSTYLISLVAGYYTAVPDGNFKGKPVTIWTPKGVEDWGEAAFKGTDNQIAIYSKLTGVDFPWQKYAQSAVPEFMFGGMENASCTTQTINALFPPDSKGTQSGEGLSAHELAHQWFGDLITAHDWSHIWVNEGWATFMPHFITRERHGEDEYQIQRYGTYQGAMFSARQNPMVRTDYTVPMEMFDGNAYPGGATRMFMLMRELGEDKFWKCCQAYLKEYAHKNVTTEQFFDSWGKTAGESLDAFRKQWFYTKGVPRLRVTRQGDDFKVEQLTPGFTFSTEVQRIGDDGLLTEKEVEFSDKQPTLISVQNAKGIIIDPGAWIMCDIDYPDYDKSLWMTAWHTAENAAQKMRLLDKFDADGIETIYKEEKSDAVKRELIPHLTDKAELISLLGSKDEREIESALDRLAALNDPAAKPEAERIFAETANEAMKNNAYDILLRINNDEKTAELGWNTTTYNLGTKIAALRWYSYHEPEKARQMALDAVRNFAPGPVRMAAIGVLGHVKDIRGDQEVFDVLIALVKARPYAPMSAAINALAEYGDKAAIPVLESRKNHSLHFARGAVASAIARLSR